jgi:hypothetical protein
LQGIFENDGTRPDALHQLVFGDERARRLDKQPQDVEGTPADRLGSPEQPKFASIEVNLAIPRRVYRSIGRHEHSERSANKASPGLFRKPALGKKRGSALSRSARLGVANALERASHRSPAKPYKPQKRGA